MADIIPSSRLPYAGTWQAAGVPGGIPDTSGWTITAMGALDYTGAASAVAAINAAITAAAANTVLTFSPGLLLIDGRITLNKNNVVLRGAADANFYSDRASAIAAGCTVFDCSGGSTSGIYAGISSSFSTPTAIQGGDIAAGTTVLSVASATGITVGKMVRILQDNDLTVPVVGVSGGLKLQGVLLMVTNVSGTDITVSPPLPFALQGALNPTMSCNANIRTNMGIEDIFFDGTNKTGPFTAQFNGVQGCWEKGCVSYNCYQYHHYWNLVMQCEIRRSRFWLERPTAHGPNMSGLKLDSSCLNLIEDNIFYQQFPSFQLNGAFNHTNSASCGNVIGYNYSAQAYNSQPYAAGDYISSHGPFPTYNLFEGNYGDKWQQDGYYGGDGWSTVHRNVLTGNNAYSPNNNRCVDLCRFTRNANVIGNILGWPGKTFVYNASGVNPAPYATRYIYRFGYPGSDNPSYTGTAQPSLGDYWADWNGGAPTIGPNGFQELDLDAEATALVKGNYNTGDEDIPAGESLGGSTDKVSHYLPADGASSPPNIVWGTLLWPWVDASTMTNGDVPNITNAAKYRADNGADPADGPPGPNAPTGLSATAVGNRKIGLAWTDQSSGTGSFKIERSLSSGAGFAQIGTSPAGVPEYDDTTVLPGVQYYYRVICSNNEGDSSPSGEADDTTGAAAPANNGRTGRLLWSTF